MALQVNNWNTNQQETKQLHSYLKNIQINLESDLIELNETKIFRDSSTFFSQNYLRIAKKDVISFDDFNSIESSNYKVYFDKYFTPHKSGFETLKNSGFIGKLTGTKVEMMLNEYYHLIDEIMDRESSLYNTIETLENVAMTETYSLRMFEIQNNIKNNREYFLSHQKEIKELLNSPSMKSANFRNRGNGLLFSYYEQGEQLANGIISEIENAVKKDN